MSDDSLNAALDAWGVPPPRDLWPEIAARLDQTDDPLGAILHALQSLRDEVAALRDENRALRWEVRGLRRLSEGKLSSLRLPEADWIGKERR